MKRVINFWSLLGFVSISVFVATEFLAVAAALVWSVSGILQFDARSTTVLAIMIAVPTLFAVIKISILAYESETDPENN